MFVCWYFIVVFLWILFYFRGIFEKLKYKQQLANMIYRYYYMDVHYNFNRMTSVFWMQLNESHSSVVLMHNVSIFGNFPAHLHSFLNTPNFYNHIFNMKIALFYSWKESTMDWSWHWLSFRCDNCNIGFFDENTNIIGKWTINLNLVFTFHQILNEFQRFFCCRIASIFNGSNDNRHIGHWIWHSMWLSLLSEATENRLIRAAGQFIGWIQEANGTNGNKW